METPSHHLNLFESHLLRYYQAASLFGDEESIERTLLAHYKWLKKSHIFDQRDLTATTIQRFIHDCKRFSRKPKDPLLKQLPTREKELIVAVHIFKLPIEQAADVLGISYSKLLKRQLQIIEKVEPSEAVIGSCSVPQTLLVEYVYDQLHFLERYKMKEHLASCQMCKQLLTRIENFSKRIHTTLSLNGPSHDFRQKLYKSIKEIKEKRDTSRSLIVMSAVALVVFVITSSSLLFKEGAFLREWTFFSDNTPVFVAEDNGIRFSITNVVADEFQTLVSFKVEHLEGDKVYYPERNVIVSELNSERERVTSSMGFWQQQSTHVDEANATYEGDFYLQPIHADEGYLSLEIRDLFVHNWDASGDWESHAVYGEWHFEIPVEKSPIVIKQVDEKITIIDQDWFIDEVIFAPTATFIHYYSETNDTHFASILTKMIDQNGEEVEAIDPLTPFETSLFTQEVWDSYLVFPPLYDDIPDQLTIKVTMAEIIKEVSFEQKLTLHEGEKTTFSFLNSDIQVSRLSGERFSTFVFTFEENIQRPFHHIDISASVKLADKVRRLNNYSFTTNSIIHLERNGQEIPEAQLERFTYQDFISLPLEISMEFSNIPEDLSDVTFEILLYSKSEFLDEKIIIDLSEESFEKRSH
ncbi:hypothetical protein P4631_01430 [Halalkalibacterium halodurans]|uniref:hypothetical protein n=1 Tax=Halalkalibacterium halodurans TaxID=86665 RepID=UPI002E2335D5|nr:hypothetical protein [Halalkalibacterium halodurans]MED4171108.1 hypothetical protein [Halalkalibacterium halodurans]